MPKGQHEKLSDLIKREDGITKLNIIRSDQKNFRYIPIKEEAAKAYEIAELYKFAKEFIPTLQLSKNAIRYYADLAEQPPVSG